MYLTKTINFCGTVHVKSITKVALDESESAEFLSSHNNQEGKTTAVQSEGLVGGTGNSK